MAPPAGIGRNGGNGTGRVDPRIQSGGTDAPVQENRPTGSGADRRPTTDTGHRDNPTYRRLSDDWRRPRQDLGNPLFGRPLTSYREQAAVAAKKLPYQFEVGQEIIRKKYGSFERIGEIIKVDGERVCLRARNKGERWVSKQELAEELMEGRSEGLQLARSIYRDGQYQWVEVPPTRSTLAPRDEFASVVAELESLLRPYLSTAILDFQKIPAKDFEEFIRYLQDHAALADGTSFTTPYRALLTNRDFWPLLELLFEQGHPLFPSPLEDVESAEQLLRQIEVELVRIDPDAFVRHHFQTDEGRARLDRMLHDRWNFDLKLRADICKGIYRAGQDVARTETYGIEWELSLWNYGNWGVSEEEVARATDAAVRVLIRARERYDRANERRGRYQEHPEETALGPIGYRKIAAAEVKRMAEIQREAEAAGDPASLMRYHLASVWLFAADVGNWYHGEIGTSKSIALRTHLLRETEALIGELRAVKNDEDFKRINEQVQNFLNRPLNLEGSPVTSAARHLFFDDGLRSHLQELPAFLREPLDQLAQYSDELRHSWEMGEVVLGDLSEVRMPDEKVRAEVIRLIEALHRTKRLLWYQYKQHKALSRAGSQVRKSLFGAGNIIDIQKAAAEIDKFIYELKNLYQADHVEQVIEDLYRSLQDGGTLYEALIAAEMDGAEQLLGLLQTTLEIVISSLVSGGIGGLARLASTGRKLQVAAETAEVAQKVGLATRAARGFGLGAYIATVENFVAVGTQEVRQGPESVQAWFKDAIATGSAMALVGLLRVPKSSRPQLMQRLWERYTSLGPLNGVKTFAADAGMEAFEELVDQYVRKVLDGNYDALTWGEVQELASICFVGSVPGAIKVGAIAEIAGKRAVPAVETKPPTNPTQTSADPTRNPTESAPEPTSGPETTRTGQIPPVAPFSVFSGPILFWNALKNSPLGQAIGRLVGRGETSGDGAQGLNLRNREGLRGVKIGPLTFDEWSAVAEKVYKEMYDDRPVLRGLKLDTFEKFLLADREQLQRTRPRAPRLDPQEWAVMQVQILLEIAREVFARQSMTSEDQFDQLKKEASAFWALRKLAEAASRGRTMSPEDLQTCSQWAQEGLGTPLDLSVLAPLELSAQEWEIWNAFNSANPGEIGSAHRVLDMIERLLTHEGAFHLNGGRRVSLDDPVVTGLIGKLVTSPLVRGLVPQRLTDLLLFKGFGPDGNRWNRTGTTQGTAGTPLTGYRLGAVGWLGDKRFETSVVPETETVVIGHDPADGGGSTVSREQARLSLDAEGNLHIENLSRNGTFRLARDESEVQRVKGPSGGKEIKSVWVPVSANEPLRVGDVIRLGLDGPVFTLTLEPRSETPEGPLLPVAPFSIFAGPILWIEALRQGKLTEAGKGIADGLKRFLGIENNGPQAARSPKAVLRSDVPILYLHGGSPLSGEHALYGDEEIIIGRQEAHADVVVPDTEVSRSHARIFHRKGRWFIEDLRSKNGITVNGKRVKNQELHPGDEIRVGEHCWTIGTQAPTTPRALEDPTTLPVRLERAAELLDEDVRYFNPADGRLPGNLELIGPDRLRHFARGDVVRGRMLGLRQEREVRPSHAETIWIKPAERADQRAYESWDKLMGFPDRETPASPRAITKLVKFAGSRGVRVSIRDGVTVSQLQIEYIEALLRTLPSRFFDARHLREILIGSERVFGEEGRGGGSIYDRNEKKIYLYSGTLVSPRRLLLAFLLHEMGHSIDDRYLHNYEMKRDFDIIRGGDDLKGNAVYHVDWTFDGTRLPYISKKFAEFIAETTVHYVTDGEGLRRHIRRLKSHPDTRTRGEAYQRVYDRLKTEVFDGKEYGNVQTVEAEDTIYQPSTPPPAPARERPFDARVRLLPRVDDGVERAAGAMPDREPEPGDPIPDAVRASLRRPLRPRGPWDPNNFKNPARAQDKALAQAAQGGTPILSRLANVVVQGKLSHESRRLRQLLDRMERSGAPEVAWVWIQALAAMGADRWGKTTVEGARTFNRVVEQTLILYEEAEAHGINLGGSVIESVARSELSVANWLAERTYRAGSNGDGSVLAQVHGAEAEVAILSALVRSYGMQGADLQVLPRSASGAASTPDLLVTRQNGGLPWVELWDIKSLASGRHGVDLDQFRRSARPAQRYRSLLVGGSAPENGHRTDVNGVPHTAHHLPSSPSPSDLQQSGLFAN